MNDELYEYFQTKIGLEIKRLAIEAGFIAWDEEEWKPAGIVFDWAGADDESLVNFCHLVVRKCADIAYEVGLHRQTKHEILRRFGLEVTDEDWYGQWQWQCGYERGWDKAMERKREWVGLSDEDIWQLRRDGAHEVSDKDFKAIEAKLKEKNSG